MTVQRPREFPEEEQPLIEGFHKADYREEQLQQESAKIGKEQASAEPRLAEVRRHQVLQLRAAEPKTGVTAFAARVTEGLDQSSFAHRQELPRLLVDAVVYFDDVPAPSRRSCRVIHCLLLPSRWMEGPALLAFGRRATGDRYQVRLSIAVELPSVNAASCTPAEGALQAQLDVPLARSDVLETTKNTLARDGGVRQCRALRATVGLEPRWHILRERYPKRDCVHVVTTSGNGRLRERATRPAGLTPI